MAFPGGSSPPLQQALLGDSQQEQRSGTKGLMAFQLPLGKESAWADGCREAAPAAASEVPPPCPQVILGEAAKGRIPVLSPSPCPVLRSSCPARTLHHALCSQPGSCSPQALGCFPTDSSRQVWSCDTTVLPAPGLGDSSVPGGRTLTSALSR